MRVAFLAAMLITALIFVWKGAVRAEGDATMAADAQLGRKVYLWTGCANCHGANARGAWRGPDLTDPHLLRVRTDQNLFDVIKHGRPDTMMAFYGDELADEQIGLIVAFLRDEGRRRDAAEVAGAR
jgi:mono/diheme cytochrome c family protein